MSDIIATAEESKVVPVVAVVGRPNVGKSTLVNRMLGRREAVVQDVPGVTRDRVSYDATWNGRQFVLVDTGGWAPDAKGMAARVTEQAELAVTAADAVVLVVDATVGTPVLSNVTDPPGSIERFFPNRQCVETSPLATRSAR